MEQGQKLFDITFKPGAKTAVMATLNGTDEMTADDLSSLIAQMALIRAAMLPPIPDDPPEDEFKFAIGCVTGVRPRAAMGGVMIAMRHPGHGWVFGHHTPAKAAAYADDIRAAIL